MKREWKEPLLEVLDINLTMWKYPKDHGKDKDKPKDPGQPDELGS